MCTECAQSGPVGYRCPDCTIELQQRAYSHPETSKRWITPWQAPLSQPIFTYLFLVANIVIFILMTLDGGTQESAVLIKWGAAYGPLILDGEYWRFFTATFLHAGFMHIGFNCYALYILGLDIERIYGPARFLVIYIISGLYGSLASFLIRGPSEFSVGASGSIFGIMGMALGLFLFYRKQLGGAGKQRFNAILRLVGINLVIGFLIVRINNAAHVGGLVSGFALAYLLAPRYKMDATVLPQSLVDFGSLAKQWWVVILSSGLVFGGLIILVQFWRGFAG